MDSCAAAEATRTATTKSRAEATRGAIRGVLRIFGVKGFCRAKLWRRRGVCLCCAGIRDGKGGLLGRGFYRPSHAAKWRIGGRPIPFPSSAGQSAVKVGSAVADVGFSRFRPASAGLRCVGGTVQHDKDAFVDPAKSARRGNGGTHAKPFQDIAGPCWLLQRAAVVVGLTPPTRGHACCWIACGPGGRLEKRQWTGRAVVVARRMRPTLNFTFFAKRE